MQWSDAMQCNANVSVICVYFSIFASFWMACWVAINRVFCVRFQEALCNTKKTSVYVFLSSTMFAVGRARISAALKAPFWHLSSVCLLSLGPIVFFFFLQIKIVQYDAKCVCVLFEGKLISIIIASIHFVGKRQCIVECYINCNKQEQRLLRSVDNTRDNLQQYNLQWT